MEKAKVVITGAGSAGLFLGAVLDVRKTEWPCIIFEAGPEPGRKLLVSGSGQCNFTRTDDIHEFLDHYGGHGKRIRSCLFRHNNIELIRFMEKLGVPHMEREDGKVFPESMRAADVRDALVSACRDNGWQIRCRCPVRSLEPAEGGNMWLINGETAGENVILCSGGLSWGKLGIGSGIMDAAKKLGMDVVDPKPALVPLYVEDFPFSDLAGISFQDAAVRIVERNGKVIAKQTGPLLITHRNFSGPAVLDISRYAQKGKILEICFADFETPDAKGSGKSLMHFLESEIPVPKRFLEKIFEICGADPKMKAASVPAKLLRKICGEIRRARFVISGSEGFGNAMATAGGISLSEISTRTFEIKKHLGLFAAGEVLDVDGDTGGYNIQFAYSSAAAAAEELEKRI